MSTVTPRLNLVKPTTLEQYALSVVNNNADLLDTSIPRVSTVASTIDTAAVSGINSRFTPIEWGGGNGVVIAQVVCVLKTSVTLPAWNANNLLIASNFCPAGYRPLMAGAQINHPGILQGSGRGDFIHWSINTDGEISMRNSTASTLATTANVILFAFSCWQWNGVL